MSFITRTALVSDIQGIGRAAKIGPRELEVLGYDKQARKVYVLEHAQDDLSKLPQLLSISAHGWLAGRTTPVHSYYLGDPYHLEEQFHERLQELRDRLLPMFQVGTDNFQMRTRVTKRRAVRIDPDAAPVRRYDLRVTVRPAASGKVVHMGARKTVTAYLRPRVRLVDVWAHPALQFAIAVVSYVGVPYQLGYDRQTAIYLPLTSHHMASGLPTAGLRNTD